MNNLLAIIEEENKKIKQLVNRLAELPKMAWEEREKIFADLKKHLQPHFEATEKTLYPAFLASQLSREDVLLLFEEHHFLRLVLRELDEMSKQATQWRAKERLFREFLTEHLEKEEEKAVEVFRASREEVLNELRNQYEATEEKVRREMAQHVIHP